jgi:hypothetical protein
LKIPLIKKPLRRIPLEFRYIRTDISSQIKPLLAIDASICGRYFLRFTPQYRAQKKSGSQPKP